MRRGKRQDLAQPLPFYTSSIPPGMDSMSVEQKSVKGTKATVSDEEGTRERVSATRLVRT